MFYSDLGVHVYRAHLSRYILRFASHYDEYVNSCLSRSVSYDAIVWC